MLGPLADNGGPTPTHALLYGSPAINAGGPTSPLATDQRGFDRIFRGRVDFGAYESHFHGDFGGDFDSDGDFDCDDINELTAAIVNGDMSPTYDINLDGYVTIADVDQWLVTAGGFQLLSGNPYLPGDANLDGVVDIADFNIWNANKFTNQTAWCSGNFNVDAFVDAADFNIWNNHKFSSALRPQALSLIHI